MPQQRSHMPQLRPSAAKNALKRKLNKCSINVFNKQCALTYPGSICYLVIFPKFYGFLNLALHKSRTFITLL